jgi:hypothetical protein
MAQTILKNVPVQAVVSVTSNQTVTLASLAIPVLQTALNPVVNIKALHFSIPNAQTATITRNGVLLWTLANSQSLKFDGFVDIRGNTSDIVVAFSGTGTVVIEMIKVSGFGGTQHVNAV